MRPRVLGLLMAASVSAQQTALVEQVTQRAALNLRRLPNYTCTETIERYLRRSGERNLLPKDVIHVNVAYIEGRELYGRPGDPQIDEPDLEHPVGPPIGNGQFASFVKTIFDGAEEWSRSRPVPR